MKNIQRVHVGEDYTTYSFVDEKGNEQDMQVSGPAQYLINALGKALHKKSFED